MPKSPRQKQKLLYLARYFWEHTDQQHTVTTPQLIAYLNANDIKAERKSIYDDLRAFREQDILDVTVPQGQNREYAVASRTFEISELKMMIDAIQSSKFLSEAKTRDLIKKLEEMPPMDETSFKAKINEIVSTYIKGKDISKLRIVVKRRESEE